MLVNHQDKKAVRLSLLPSVLTMIGSAVLAFGLYHVHSISNVTEGGVLGLTLLFHHHFHISPALSAAALNAACYLFGWRILGSRFVVYSLLAGGFFSIFYAFFERFPPLLPQLAEHPLWAAILGAIFVGVGVGLCVRAGGAPSGDDALAMGISHIAKIPIEWVYLASDLSVLALSLTYIPPKKLVFSLLTVVLSGQLIGWIQKVPYKKHSEKEYKQT